MTYSEIKTKEQAEKELRIIEQDIKKGIYISEKIIDHITNVLFSLSPVKEPVCKRQGVIAYY